MLKSFYASAELDTSIFRANNLFKVNVYVIPRNNEPLQGTETEKATIVFPATDIEA